MPLSKCFNWTINKKTRLATIRVNVKFIKIQNEVTRMNYKHYPIGKTPNIMVLLLE